MRVLTREEVELSRIGLSGEIAGGAIFIYPTDTIYGIGCNALDDRAVSRVRGIKQRNSKPFSVIVPSKEWIAKNCVVNDEARRWIDKLPGPYTLILRLKNPRLLSNAVNCGLETIGVRIPRHWFSGFVMQLGLPVITTSANITGGNFMTSLEDLDVRVSSRVDFIVYDGPLDGRPSTIVNLTGDRAEVTER